MVVVEEEFVGGGSRNNGAVYSLENEFLLEAIEDSIANGTPLSIPPPYSKAGSSSDQPPELTDTSVSSVGTGSTADQLPDPFITRSASHQSLLSAHTEQSFRVKGSWEEDEDLQPGTFGLLDETNEILDLSLAKGKAEDQPIAFDSVLSNFVDSWGEDGQFILSESLASGAFDASELQKILVKIGGDDCSLLEDEDCPYDERTPEEWMAIVLKLYESLQQSEAELSQEQMKRSASEQNVANLVEELAEKEDDLSAQRRRIEKLKNDLEVQRTEKLMVERQLKQYEQNCDEERDTTLQDLEKDLRETRIHFEGICEGYEKRISDIKASHAVQCADLCREVVEVNKENARLRKLLEEQAAKARGPSLRALLGAFFFAASGVLAKNGPTNHTAPAMRMRNVPFAEVDIPSLPIPEVMYDSELCPDEGSENCSIESKDISKTGSLEFFDAEQGELSKCEGDETSDSVAKEQSELGDTEEMLREAPKAEIEESVLDFHQEVPVLQQSEDETVISALSGTPNGEPTPVLGATEEEEELIKVERTEKPSKRRRVVFRIRKSVSKRGSRILGLISTKTGWRKARKAKALFRRLNRM